MQCGRVLMSRVGRRLNGIKLVNFPFGITVGWGKCEWETWESLEPWMQP